MARHQDVKNYTAGKCAFNKLDSFKLHNVKPSFFGPKNFELMRFHIFSTLSQTRKSTIYACGGMDANLDML
jgi:hypothetical protein